LVSSLAARASVKNMVVGSNNRVELRPVTIERMVEDQWLIGAGLQSGERIVVDGFQRVRAGITVTPVPSRAKPGQPESAPFPRSQQPGNFAGAKAGCSHLASRQGIERCGALRRKRAMNAIADIHTVSGVEPLPALDGCRSIFGLQELAVDGCWNTSTKVRTFTVARCLHGMSLETTYA